MSYRSDSGSFRSFMSENEEYIYDDEFHYKEYSSLSEFQEQTNIDDAEYLYDDYIKKQDQQMDRIERGINKRELFIEKISQDVNDINDIFRMLSYTVNEQSYLLDNVENNINCVVENTELADRELVSASKKQNNIKKYLLHILMFLLIILIIVIIIIVVFKT